MSKSISIEESMSLSKAVEIVEANGSIISQDGAFRLDRDDFANDNVRVSKWNSYHNEWEKEYALPMKNWSRRVDAYPWSDAVQIMIDGGAIRRVDWDTGEYLAMYCGYIYRYSESGLKSEKSYSPHVSDMSPDIDWIMGDPVEPEIDDDRP